MIDNMIMIFALRYAIGQEGMALPVVAKYITENIHSIPNLDLQTMLEDLTEYYSEHTDDRHYILATQLCVTIRRELYD